jgi:hypothetical protein
MSIDLIRRKLMFASVAAPLLAGCASLRPGRIVHQEVRVAAPFEMPAIRVPDFSGMPRFPITDFGADRGRSARRPMPSRGPSPPPMLPAAASWWCRRAYGRPRRFT